MNEYYNDFWLPLAGSLLLLILNALLVAAELALIKVRLSHFTPELIERVAAKPRLARLVDKPDRTIRLIRFGSTVCVVGYSLLAVPFIIFVAGAVAAAWGGFAAVATIVLLVIIAISLLYALGELVPRGLGLQYPEGSLKLAVFALMLVAPLRAALVKPLNTVSQILLRRFGVTEHRDLESLDIEAQIEFVGEGKPMTAIARKVFRNTLQMRGLVVSDIMLPRHQVQWFDLSDSTEANLELARNTGHTRFPLCDGDLDRCVGLVHIKDLFRRRGDLKDIEFREFRREILRVSPEDAVEDALQKLLAARMHLALVVDEFRGTEGIITLERILELLVGDIRDEFDVEEDNIKVLNGGEFSVSGLTPVHEVEQALDVTIENEDVSTFGGLITSELGRIPERGETLELEGLVVTVTDTDERRVIRARVRRMPQIKDEE